MITHSIVLETKKCFKLVAIPFLSSLASSFLLDANIAKLQSRLNVWSEVWHVLAMKDICGCTKDILEVTKVSSALPCTCNSQSRSSCMSLQSKPRARPSTWRGTPQCELPSTSESLGLSLWQPCAEMRVNGTGTALPPRRFIVHSDSDAILVDGCDGALMNNFFWPTSRKVLPTFQTFCPGGPGSILPRW